MSAALSLPVVMTSKFGDDLRRDARGRLFAINEHIGPFYVTECCHAAVTYSQDDGVLCCKACWHEVDRALDATPVIPTD